MICLHYVSQLLRRAICAVIGHDVLLQFGHRRLSLRCMTCGHETTGWSIGEPPSDPHATSTPSPVRTEARHAA